LNHRRMASSISAYIDGELDPRESDMLSRHLEACGRCRAREAELRRLRDGLAGLPRLQLSEAGHLRLMRGVAEAERKREGEERARKALLFPRIATAAAVMLAILAVMVAVMTTPTSKRSALDEESEKTVAQERETPGGETAAFTEEPREGDAAAAGGKSPSTDASALMAAIPAPRLSATGRDYAKSQVNGYSADLGARLDFYSQVWHAAGPGGIDVAAARKQCRRTLAEQAARLELDPQKLLGALDAAESRMGSGADALPCFVEVAAYEGRKACIISYSSPEDRLLFADSNLVSLVNLIRSSSPDGLMRSSEAQGPLALSMMPSPLYEVAMTPREMETGGPAAPYDIGDFQSVLSALATENNLISYLRQLAELDAGHLLTAVSQELGYPVEVSNRLLDLLTLRVWVVDLESGEVLVTPLRR